jgi:hypothetical protein
MLRLIATTLQSIVCRVGVMDSMPEIVVTKVVLNKARAVAFVGKRKAARSEALIRLL